MLRTYPIISRHEGLFALASVIPTFFILFPGFRRSQRWAWWAILFTGLLAWGWGLGESLTHRSWVNFFLQVFGTALLLEGLLLALKVFFPKKENR